MLKEKHTAFQVMLLLFMIGLLSHASYVAAGDGIAGFSAQYQYEANNYKETGTNYLTCMSNSCIRLCTRTNLFVGSYGFAINVCEEQQTVMYGCLPFRSNSVFVKNQTLPRNVHAQLYCESYATYWDAVLLSSNNA